MSLRPEIRGLILSTITVYLSASLWGCPPEPVSPDSNATCKTTCDHWRSLGCEEAKPTSAGGTCEDVCLNIQGSGIISWNLPCRATVKACEDIDRCER